MPVVTNLHPDLGDIAERVDNGRRLALVETAPQPESLSTVERLRIEEFNTPRAELAKERLEDARVEMREAMRVVDTEADRDLHLAIAQHIERHDDLLAVIRERLS